MIVWCVLLGCGCCWCCSSRCSGCWCCSNRCSSCWCILKYKRLILDWNRYPLENFSNEISNQFIIKFVIYYEKTIIIQLTILINIPLEWQNLRLLMKRPGQPRRQCPNPLLVRMLMQHVIQPRLEHHQHRPHEGFVGCIGQAQPGDLCPQTLKRIVK